MTKVGKIRKVTDGWCCDFGFTAVYTRTLGAAKAVKGLVTKNSRNNQPIFSGVEDILDNEEFYQ